MVLSTLKNLALHKIYVLFLLELICNNISSKVERSELHWLLFIIRRRDLTASKEVLLFGEKFATHNKRCLGEFFLSSWWGPFVIGFNEHKMRLIQIADIMYVDIKATSCRYRPWMWSMQKLCINWVPREVTIEISLKMMPKLFQVAYASAIFLRSDSKT